MLTNEEMAELIKQAAAHGDIALNPGADFSCDSECDECSLINTCEQLAGDQEYGMFLVNYLRDVEPLL